MWQRAVWARIDLTAIKYNICSIKKNLAPGIKICAVVKADAYGHGAMPVAAAALAAGADTLAVAILQEALELRKNGIVQPILVLGFTPPRQAYLAVAAEVTQTIYCREAALALSEAALAAKTKIKVHIKVDTGMGRIGLTPADAPDFADFVAKLPGLTLEGIFSHLADADNPDQTYTKEQLASFQEVLDKLKARGIFVPVRHLSNSAAAIDMPAAHFDMIRLGIAMYGLWPSPQIKKAYAPGLELKPAMSLIAQISHLKEVPSGRSISYGRTYFTDAVKKIATIPIGYADGLNRNLSGKMSVFFNGRHAPLVGRICMDQCMADVSGIDGIKTGDTAVIFGPGGLTADEVADILGTINYEIVCNVGKRVPRAYY